MMASDKKIVVVIPAFNAEKTLTDTFNEIPKELIDDIVLADDGSTDKTASISRNLGIRTFSHSKNKGYGAAMKTCFSEALNLGADIIVVVHSDNQYFPGLLIRMSEIIKNGSSDVVLASRMLDKNVFKIMPFYRYVANKILTGMQNLVFSHRLSEYQTGFRAYKTEVLRNVRYMKNSDDFVFDNELLAQIFHKKFSVAEIPCPVKYTDETSSINIPKSFKYFFNVLSVSFNYLLHRAGIKKYKILI
ncbi:MAG: glycosyltransferase family 2 protein [Actinobacteria bacterium]|nr:glycosyltransferase family 2 protein [Actinomycetota bacterium]